MAGKLDDGIPLWSEALGETLDAFAEKEALGYLLMAIAAAVVELPDEELSTESLLSAIERRAQMLEDLLLPEAIVEFRRCLQAWILAVRMVQRAADQS